MTKDFSKKDYEAITKKTEYRCAICDSFNITFPPHHILFKSFSGVGSIDNGVCLCAKCHYIIHHGKENSQLYKRLCYEYIGDITKCYDCKIEPFQVNKIKNDEIYLKSRS